MLQCRPLEACRRTLQGLLCVAERLQRRAGCRYCLEGKQAPGQRTGGGVVLARRSGLGHASPPRSTHSDSALPICSHTPLAVQSAALNTTVTLVVTLGPPGPSSSPPPPNSSRPSRPPPPPTSPPPPSTPEGSCVYTVVSGDTLWEIAQVGGSGQGSVGTALMRQRGSRRMLTHPT